MPGMFVLIAFAIWSAMNAYVIWRIVTLPLIEPTVPRWAAATAGVLLASSWLLARIVENRRPGAFARTLEWVGAEWMGVVLIALACFFIADVVTGFGRFTPAHAPMVRTVALGAAILLSAIATVNAMRPPVVREHTVRIASLPAERDGAVVV